MSDANGTSTDTLVVVHHHPGRVRLRSGAFLGEADERLVRARHALEQTAGVVGVTHRPDTGSLVVDYRPGRVDADELIGVAAAASRLPVVFDPQRDTIDWGASIASAVRTLNRAVYTVTGARADLGVIVPFGLAALGAYSFLRSPERKLPRWDNLAYWTYSIFSTMHSRRTSGSDAPSSSMQ